MAIERGALPKQVVHTDFGAALAMISDGEVSEERPPRWAAFRIGSKRRSSQSAIAGLNWQVLSSTKPPRPEPCETQQELHAWLFVEHSSAKARREKAPDD
jgi:hypothetical protein